LIPRTPTLLHASTPDSRFVPWEGTGRMTMTEGPLHGMTAMGERASFPSRCLGVSVPSSERYSILTMIFGHFRKCNWTFHPPMMVLPLHRVALTSRHHRQCQSMMHERWLLGGDIVVGASAKSPGLDSLIAHQPFDTFHLCSSIVHRCASTRIRLATNAFSLQTSF